MKDIDGGCWKMLVEDIGGGCWWRQKHFLKKKNFQSLNLISILLTHELKRSRLKERKENGKKKLKKNSNLISILLTHELSNNKKVEIERKKQKFKKTKFKKNFWIFFFEFFSKSESH